jgi:rRNA maturation protein Rpf1|tara:strand:- start:245 stop:457 length:213 start_codon:yes stop_codon:yes gene_type:complete
MPKVSKSLLEYQLSSDGSVLLHIEDIRDFILEEIRLTKDHNKICRAFESVSGHLVINQQDDDEDIKTVQK